jgi:exopolysaccharide biosynthesis polyprenyl glycosylphosphotransferase
VSPGERKNRSLGLQTGERVLLLIVGDLFMASIATFVALAMWAQLDWLGFSIEFVRARATWFVLLPLVWLLLMVNMYELRRAGSWRETQRGIIGAATIGVVLYLVVYFSSPPGSLPRRAVLYFLFLAVVLTALWRWTYVRVFTTPTFMRRILIVGAGDSGRTMCSLIQGMRPPPFDLIGFVDDDRTKQGQEIDGVKVLGGNEELLELIEANQISDIIVAILGPMNGEMFQALLDAQERGLQIIRMPLAYEELLGQVPIRHLESDWLLRSFVDELRVSEFYMLAKRMLDILGGLTGVIILLLIYPWVGLAILLESGRPITFIQTRLGKGGNPFGTYKFRTMHQDAEADGQAHWAVVGDPRTTRVGRLLRKIHLDEFPQFIHVLTGDMSLVGPRPERPELVIELEKQIPFYRARLLVKPGITGWAQINYGKGASIEGSAEKLEYDLYYIKHRGLLMDIRILLRTVGSMLGLRGV